MNVAFVQNAEHDVDDDDCRQNQIGLRTERGLKFSGRPGKTGGNGVGQTDFGFRRFDCFHGLPERLSRGQIKRNSDRRERDSDEGRREGRWWSAWWRKPRVGLADRRW